MKPIKSTKKVIGIGQSIGVVIDKSLTSSCGIGKGDLVEISFKKIRGWKYASKKRY